MKLHVPFKIRIINLILTLKIHLLFFQEGCRRFFICPESIFTIYADGVVKNTISQ
jgi:hypothetical protein